MDFFSFCEDEALKVKVAGLPIHKFFAPEGFLMYGLEPNQGNFDGYNQIVDMPIDEFLGLAEPIPDDDEKRHAPMEEFKNDVLNGTYPTNWDLPYLVIKENEDGIWKVVGHDGRHRGMLLKSIKHDTMPVLLKMPEADLNEELLPEILWCQNDKSVKREKDFYPFPITEDNFRKPYIAVDDVQPFVEDGITKVSMDEDVYPAGCDSSNLKRYLAGNDLSVETKDGAGKAPDSCMAAKRNFAKNFVPNVAYRKDNTMPASNLKEYLKKKGN